MEKIKTGYSERRLTRDLIDDGLRLVAERSECVGVSKDTAKRHAAAIRGVTPALGVAKNKVIKPGIWVALYTKNDSSTVISNMKFAAVIFEWAGEQDYENAGFYAHIAKAIRTALAVRGETVQ